MGEGLVVLTLPHWNSRRRRRHRHAAFCITEDNRGLNQVVLTIAALKDHGLARAGRCLRARNHDNRGGGGSNEWRKKMSNVWHPGRSSLISRRCCRRCLPCGCSPNYMRSGNGRHVQGCDPPSQRSSLRHFARMHASASWRRTTRGPVVEKNTNEKLVTRRGRVQ